METIEIIQTDEQRKAYLLKRSNLFKTWKKKIYQRNVLLLIEKYAERFELFKRVCTSWEENKRRSTNARTRVVGDNVDKKNAI
jgi:hypothetical protein